MLINSKHRKLPDGDVAMARTKNVASLFEKKTKVSAVDLVINSIKNILLQKKMLKRK